MKVVWRDEAISNLERSYSFIALYSQQAATRIINRIVERADRLGDFPYMGRVVPELENPELRELIISPYRVIYRVLPDAVEVLAVHHSAQENLPDIG